jgi:hypothetical protein
MQNAAVFVTLRNGDGGRVARVLLQQQLLRAISINGAPHAVGRAIA